jgi:hypothetical protein
MSNLVSERMSLCYCGADLLSTPIGVEVIQSGILTLSGFWIAWDPLGTLNYGTRPCGDAPSKPWNVLRVRLVGTNNAIVLAPPLQSHCQPATLCSRCPGMSL